MASITLQQVRQLQEKAQSALSRARTARHNATKQIEQATQTVVQSLEVGGSSFGFGLVTGRYGGVEVLGVPGDLAAGLALHAAAFFVDDEHTADHLHNFGDGCTAAYLHTLGLGIGRRWASESNAQPALPRSSAAAPSAQP